MKIYFQPNAESEKAILSDTIPRKVGIAFSQAIKDHLQNQNMTGAFFTITSGDKLTITTILRWMMTSCNGFGLTSFEPHATFGEILSYLQTASDLEIPTLSNILYDRLQNRISKPVIEDARAIYSLLDSKHPLRILFVQTVSECIGSRTLKNWGKFIEFAKENKEYAMDVEQYRKILNAPQIEARRAARREQNRAYWATFRTGQYEAYLIRKNKREDRAKAQEEWERTRTFAGKGVKGRETSNGKTSRDVTKGMDHNTRGRGVLASEYAEKDTTSDGSATAQTKTSATENTTIDETPEKKIDPVTNLRPKVAVILDLTKTQPTITIGDVTKEIALTVGVDGPEEAVNVKSPRDSAKDGNKGKGVKDGKGKDDKDKEGGHPAVIAQKKKQKKH